jgi:RNA polymerase sigma-70 factor (ECF subfamily)
MDLALVEAARSGDEEAFASIARGSADRLFVVAHRILRDVGRAEDAVQQTLVTAWRELPALRETERFEAWLHRILVHACYAEAKRASKWSANVVALPIDGPATPDTTHDIVTRDSLDRGFRRLPTDLGSSGANANRAFTGSPVFWGGTMLVIDGADLMAYR